MCSLGVPVGEAKGVVLDLCCDLKSRDSRRDLRRAGMAKLQFGQRAVADTSMTRVTSRVVREFKTPQCRARRGGSVVRE